MKDKLKRIALELLENMEEWGWRDQQPRANLKDEKMRHYLFGLIILFTFCCCNNSKTKTITKSELRTDTIAVDIKPNNYIKTIQYVKGDTLNGKVAKEAFYLDSILIKEVYKDYMSSEYEGYGDGEYQYFYNKDKKLIFKYFIDGGSGDSTKYVYKYFTNRDCEVTVYDFRKRLKSDMPHGDVLGPEDFTDYRIWLYDTKWVDSFDENNKLIRHYEINDDPTMNSQNLYTYTYIDNRLMESKSFLNDSILYWSEKYEYSSGEINMIHENISEKDNSWILPYYYEKTKLDNKGNKIIIEEFDNHKDLMGRSVMRYDLKNRLIKLDYYNEKNILRLRHLLFYELNKQ